MNRSKTKKRITRQGAILLDLFIATALFATSILIIGEYGSRSLRMAQINGIERIAAITAESILAKEATLKNPEGDREWMESIRGISMQIRASRKSLEPKRLKRITVRVTSASGNLTNQPSVTLSRLVLMDGDS